MDEYLDKVFALAKGKPVMLGMYLWDYTEAKCLMDTALFTKQLDHYFDLLKNKSIEGVIFCSSTIGDADLETNKILKEYIKKYYPRIAVSLQKIGNRGRTWACSVTSHLSYRLRNFLGQGSCHQLALRTQ